MSPVRNDKKDVVVQRGQDRFCGRAGLDRRRQAFCRMRQSGVACRVCPGVVWIYAADAVRWRRSVGLAPVQRRKARLKALWLEKPSRKVMSVMLLSGSLI